MLDFRSTENDNRKRYKKQVLLLSKRIQLCFIDAINNLYDQILEINIINENCSIYRETLKIKQIHSKNVNFKNCSIKNGILYRKNKL